MPDRVRPRRYNAHDADEAGFREWRNRKTNEPITEPEDWHDPALMLQVAYRLRRERVAQLRDLAAAELVFLFGAVDNELEAIIGWSGSLERNYRRYGAAIVDATLPIDTAADDVLRAAAASS